jgi:hypothetical protein
MHDEHRVRRPTKGDKRFVTAAKKGGVAIRESAMQSKLHD